MESLSQIISHKHMTKITSEFQRLKDRCYLENVGAVLYPESLLKLISSDLMNNVYFNPHSDQNTKECIDQIRSRILQHFNTDSTEYTVVFTSGTTQALKLAVESFQFSSDKDDPISPGSYVYLRDNHTSVLGLREIAKDKNADVIHIPHNEFLASVGQQKQNSSNWKENHKCYGNTLFVYPAQSNFNGFKYPLDKLDLIKNCCLNSYLKKTCNKETYNWYILLDAACYVATNKLDLSKTKPDFVCLSFYKIFGYPSGLGALIIRNSSAHVLSQKKYFGGGTVDIVLSSEIFHSKRKNLCERFEDGTIPFLSIISLKHCFDLLNKLIPRVINNNIMETISHHTFYLAKHLYQQLQELTHSNGRKVAVMYMDSDFSSIEKQGSTVTFSLMRADKSHIGYTEFQNMADLYNISVRTGCFCNSGSCQRHLNVTNVEMKSMFKAGHVCGDNMDLVNGMPTGAIRASFGYYNTFNDVDKLLLMISKCFLKTPFKIPVRTPKPRNTEFEIPHKTIILKPIPKIKPEIIKQNYFYKGNYIQNQTKQKITVKEIAIFPIKSCGALKIKSSWKIGSKGFEYDREWMIIKDNGVCLTQKQNSKMCLIKPYIDLKLNIMTLHFKGKSSISIPLKQPKNIKYRESSICRSKVCSDFVQGYDCGDAVGNWISEALGMSYLRLIKQAPTDVRNHNVSTIRLSFSNQAQFLLVNTATVQWLSKKINPAFSEHIDSLTDRFRGNIIINMEKEFVERQWHRLRIGNQEFQVEGDCNRCQMICIDQSTGEKTVEPLRTIAQELEGKLKFGIYLSYVGPIDRSEDCNLHTNAPVTVFEQSDRSIDVKKTLLIKI